MISMRVEINRKMQALRDAVRKEIRQPGSDTRAKLIKEVGDVDLKQNAQAFATEGVKSGRKWEGLEKEHPGYARWKRRNWPNRKLLVWTGAMTRNPLTQARHELRVARMRGAVLEFGTSSRIIAESMEERKFSPKLVVYLREKKPVRKRNKRTGEMTKGRNWYRFVTDRVPARPAVRKSAEQAKHLKLTIARVLLSRQAQIAGGSSTALGKSLAAAAGGIRVDPRA